MKSFRKFSSSFKEQSDSGQTAVEYILLFAIVIVMTLGLMKQIKDRMVGDIENCQANNQSLGCKIEGAFPVGNYQNFRFYRVM